jgi:pyridoxal phosphate enzyme (YggS family)
LTESLTANLAHVREEIAATARAAGRRPEDIRLVAVTKTHPPATVAAALAAGQVDFGENTVQEALTKIPIYASATWHLIGHLQSNKSKFVPGHFAWVHSLDSLKLTQRLSRQAAEKGVVLDALFEVNVTRDPAKHGLAPAKLAPVFDALLKEGHPGLRLRGLMTIGPYPATEAESRACFARLRALRDESQKRFGLKDFSELSMGMSGDYVAAIKEGSTIVRIGTAIFGERDYSDK